MEDDLPSFAKVSTVIVCLCTSAFSLWCTVIAFAGGELPIIGLELKGSVASGLLFLLIIDPLFVGFCGVVWSALMAIILSRGQR